MTLPNLRWQNCHIVSCHDRLIFTNCLSDSVLLSGNTEVGQYVLNEFSLSVLLLRLPFLYRCVWYEDCVCTLYGMQPQCIGRNLEQRRIPRTAVFQCTSAVINIKHRCGLTPFDCCLIDQDCITHTPYTLLSSEDSRSMCFSVLSADNKHILGKSAFAWDMVLRQWAIVALCFETPWSSWKVRHQTPSDVVPLPRRAGISTAALQKTEHSYIIGSCDQPSVYLYYLWNYSKDFNMVEYDIYTKTCQVNWILIIPIFTFSSCHVIMNFLRNSQVLPAIKYRSLYTLLYVPKYKMILLHSLQFSGQYIYTEYV